MKTALVTLDSSKSLAANYTSPPLITQQDFGVYIQAVWTGTPVGTFKLQTSNSYQPGGAVPGGGPAAAAGSWDDYPSSSQDSTGVTSCSWNVADIFFPWVRVVFTSTSGTGTLTKLLCFTKGL